MWTDFNYFSLLQQKIYDAQKLRHFSHLTFIMLPLYLAKQTLITLYIRTGVQSGIYGADTGQLL